MFDLADLASGAQNTIGELLGGLTNPFGAPSLGEWNLARGIYTSKSSKKEMVFFYETSKEHDRLSHTGLEQISDNGARRLAIYEYAYRDGQRIKDLGRKGEKFIFNIKFWGPNYQDKLDRFIKVIANDSGGGTIIHPVRGSVDVKFQEYEFIHRYDEWNAVTIRATFLEDATDTILASRPPESNDSAIRQAFQAIVDAQSALYNALFNIEALTHVGDAIKASFQARLDSLTAQYSRTVARLAVTFGEDRTLQEISANNNPIPSINNGTVPSTGGGTGTNTGNGFSQTTTLPPMFQVGFDPTTQDAINKKVDDFISANQITPQEAVYAANEIRKGISEAITEIETWFGNYGYDMILVYRGLANTIQSTTEVAISLSKNKIKFYEVPRPMSLRMIASLNNLSVDKQNEIEKMNPYLPSVNFIPRGTVVVIPA